ncbi:histidine--tRNA ligase [Clostridium senegalense]|uniref:histidine--tRNA ligase n=1 Tax=Clostridium senegalense TaxID=1465809 RepID=UPI0002898C95|nr:histidine--tRNA ligase [Clostridium senegalense]MBU5225681.1 histidine--tRNA ligase [Clostridium senegalense]
MNFKAPKGTKDILPSEVYKWHYVENLMRDIAAKYGCLEVRTPMFESTDLFKRGVGETTDIVQKEMYTFEDKGGRSITLKPEGTAPAVRAFVENALYADAQPTKLYYFTPAFRYEKMQKGRLRQHHQFGVEVFGSQQASVDAEIISIIMDVYKHFGIEGLELHINNLGCPNCRQKYNDALKEYLELKKEGLCPTCHSRLEKNPLRILDCKVEACKEIVKDAPITLDYVCDECKNHFENLKTYLEAIGISYIVDPMVVRGLDYYTKTIFEVMDNGFTLCGGGRYDGLIKEIGGQDIPAVGFGMGMERLLLTLEEKGIEIPKPNYIDAYIVSMGESSKIEAVKLVNSLRHVGIKADCDHVGRSVKAQMKFANKIGASFTAVLGEEEINNRKFKLKRMDDGNQFELSLDNINDISNIIKNN